MKRYRWLRFLAFALCLLLSFSQAQAAMKENEAREKAYAVLKERHELFPDDLDYNQSHYDKHTGDWTFSFTRKVHPETDDGLAVVVLKRNGTLKEMRGPNEISLGQLINYAYHLLEYEEVTMESFYLFRQEWISRLDELMPWKEKFYTADYIYALEQEILLPKPDMLEWEAALELAKQSVLSMPGWTQEKLDMLPCDISICYQSKEVGKPTYIFFLRQVNSGAKTYADVKWETYEEMYIQPLSHLFGENQAPQYVSVRLDAYTGELLGEPYESVFYNNADEFIRKYWQLK